MEICRTQWDKLLMLAMLVCLVGASSVESVSMRDTTSMLTNAIDMTDVNNGKSTVAVLDGGIFSVGTGPRLHITKHEPLEGTLFHPAAYIYPRTYKRLRGYQEIIHVTGEAQGSGRIEPKELHIPIGFDSDGEGIPDVVEDQLGLDKNNRVDEYGDLDGDLFSNIQEYRAFNGDLSAITDPLIHPPLIAHVRLLDVRRGILPFQLTNVNPTDPEDKGTWEIHMNVWELKGNKRRRVTHFLKLGKSIAKTGYVLTAVTYEMRSVKTKGLGRMNIPVFTATVQKAGGPAIVMKPKKAQPMPSPEYRLVNMYDLPFRQIKDIRVGSMVRLTDRAGAEQIYRVKQLKAAAVIFDRPGDAEQIQYHASKVSAGDLARRRAWLQQAKQAYVQK